MGGSLSLFLRASPVYFQVAETFALADQLKENRIEKTVTWLMIQILPNATVCII
ncbi:MAG TPA: hypothetical protein VGK38_09620 [Prolixibacteraceae bacterium]|jgi:hypothetical protein